MARLACREDGAPDAPTLVLLGSLGTTRDMWLPQLEALSRRWRVVRFDLPGHGASPVWDGPVSVSSIGQALIDALDSLGRGTVSFCGLSLGGAVGQWLGAHAAERVDRLVLCCTSPHFGAREAYLQRAAQVRAQGMGVVAEAVVGRWFTSDFHARQPAVAGGYRAMLEGIPPEGYAACCEAVAEFDGRDELTAIEAPTLVIAGADDPATPVEHARALFEGIAGARLRIIPRAAHLASVEQPEAVESAIMSYLHEGRHV